MNFDFTRDTAKTMYRLPYEAIDEAYEEAKREIYQALSLPPVHLWETGFETGDASREEISRLAEKHNLPDWEDDVLDFLNRKFDEMYAERLSQAEPEWRRVVDSASVSFFIKSKRPMIDLALESEAFEVRETGGEFTNDLDEFPFYLVCRGQHLSYAAWGLDEEMPLIDALSDYDYLTDHTEMICDIVGIEFSVDANYEQQRELKRQEQEFIDVQREFIDEEYRLYGERR